MKQWVRDSPKGKTDTCISQDLSARSWERNFGVKRGWVSPKWEIRRTRGCCQWGSLGSEVAMREGGRMTLKTTLLPLSFFKSPWDPYSPQSSSDSLRKEGEVVPTAVGSAVMSRKRGKCNSKINPTTSIYINITFSTSSTPTLKQNRLPLLILCTFTP